MPISLEDIALSYNFTSIKKAVINSTFTYFLQKFIANGEKFGLIGGLSGMNPRLFCNPLSCIIYMLCLQTLFSPPIHTALLVYICATREEKIHHFVLGSTKKGGVPFPRVFCASEKNVPQWSISHSQHSTTQRVHMKLFLMHI